MRAQAGKVEGTSKAETVITSDTSMKVAMTTSTSAGETMDMEFEMKFIGSDCAGVAED